MYLSLKGVKKTYLLVVFDLSTVVFLTHMKEVQGKISMFMVIIFWVGCSQQQEQKTGLQIKSEADTFTQPRTVLQPIEKSIQ